MLARLPSLGSTAATRRLTLRALQTRRDSVVAERRRSQSQLQLARDSQSMLVGTHIVWAIFKRVIPLFYVYCVLQRVQRSLAFKKGVIVKNQISFYLLELTKPANHYRGNPSLFPLVFLNR